MIKLLLLFLSIFCFSIPFLVAQNSDTSSAYYYNQGLLEASNKNIEKAKELFKKSVHEKDNGPAEYELAKIYKADTSHVMWNISREHIKNAISLEPRNIKYRFFYAKLAMDLSERHSTELVTEDDARRQYQEILKIDSTNAEALAGLGAVKANEFLDFHNAREKFPDPVGFHDATKNVQRELSYRQLGDTRSGQLYELNNITSANLNGYAEKDFKAAENALLKSIKYDSLNPAPYLTLATIYEDNHQSAKGIAPLSRLTKLKPSNKEARLQLGLLYYRAGEPDKAYNEFKEALKLMSTEEWKDFTFNSTLVLIGPFLHDKLSDISEVNYYNIIKTFWKARDPLHLTKYNERLLEHYVRVAYANLRFSLPGHHLDGWKTDRGITVIRYGIPPARIRIRPDLHKPKTDVWIYRDKTFSFTDKFMNGLFKYAKPWDTQYYGDSQDYAADLLADQKEAYNPVFNGPRFIVPYRAARFKDPGEDNLTDVIVYYGMPVARAEKSGDDYLIPHRLGLFFLDRQFDIVADNERRISSMPSGDMVNLADSGSFLVGSIEMKSPPDSGNFSFEIIRNSDKGVATYHYAYNVTNFGGTAPLLSDIVLAFGVDRNNDETGILRRKDYSILPNPAGIFAKDQPIYIYYEVYNLALAGDGLTDFTQDIVLQKKSDKGAIAGIFSPVLKLIGINNEQQSVSLTSKYRTKEKDSRIYFQLDMGNNEPGNYVLTVKIKDNISGKETEQSTELTWK